LIQKLNEIKCYGMKLKQNQENNNNNNNKFYWIVKEFICPDHYDKKANKFYWKDCFALNSYLNNFIREM
jgi:hypothetical protein